MRVRWDRQAVADAIANNGAAVADYKSGKTAAIGRLVGVVMKTTRGAANPGLVNELFVRSSTRPETE